MGVSTVAEEGRMELQIAQLRDHFTSYGNLSFAKGFPMFLITQIHLEMDPLPIFENAHGPAVFYSI